MEKRRCVWCKAEFAPKINCKIYCSRKCKEKDYRAKNEAKYREYGKARWKAIKKARGMRKCGLESCNVEFESMGKKRKYCSIKCRNIAYTKTPEYRARQKVYYYNPKATTQRQERNKAYWKARKPIHEKRKCKREGCNVEFVPGRSDKEYCTRKCREKIRGKMRRASQRAYYHSPKGKAYWQSYTKGPSFKKNQKAYREKPEVKERAKKRHKERLRADRLLKNQLTIMNALTQLQEFLNERRTDSPERNGQSGPDQGNVA